MSGPSQSLRVAHRPTGAGILSAESHITGAVIVARVLPSLRTSNEPSLPGTNRPSARLSGTRYSIGTAPVVGAFSRTREKLKPSGIEVNTRSAASAASWNVSVSPFGIDCGNLVGQPSVSAALPLAPLRVARFLSPPSENTTSYGTAFGAKPLPADSMVGSTATHLSSSARERTTPE